MKRFKLSIALLSSGLMAYSPVLQAASITPDQKTAINRVLSESTQGTFSDVYQRSGIFLDESSRGFMEAWLEKYGKTKFNPPQAQIVKDKNGQDLVKVILSQFDQTMTITIDPADTKSVDINGAKIQTQNLQSLPLLMSALAEKNSALAPLAKELKTAQAPKAHKESVLTIEQFMALAPIERVHYMVLIRQYTDAGAKVLAAQDSQTPQASFIVNPLWSVFPAFAGDLRKLGDTCVVAGNLSVFEDGPYWKWEGEAAKKVNGRHCSIAPKQSGKFLPPPNVSSLCEQVPHTGELVACPAMTHKMDIKKDASGKMRAYPICQDTARKGFSETATSVCNEASPLPGEKGSPERLKAYEEILKGYALAKGGDYDKIKACFAEDHTVKPDCLDMFKPHMEAFISFREKVMTVCSDGRKMPKDQADACDEAKKRSLGLYKYIADATGIVTPAPSDDPNHVPVIEKSTFATPEKDKCKEKENKNSFSCNTGLWLGIGGAALAAWLLWPKNKKPKTPQCPSMGMMIGGPVPAGCPPIIIPPWNPQPWPTEGTTGKTTTGNVGGVRGAQPQPAGSK